MAGAEGPKIGAEGRDDFAPFWPLEKPFPEQKVSTLNESAPMWVLSQQADSTVLCTRMLPFQSYVVCVFLLQPATEKEKEISNSCYT